MGHYCVDCCGYFGRVGVASVRGVSVLAMKKRGRGLGGQMVRGIAWSEEGPVDNGHRERMCAE